MERRALGGDHGGAVKRDEGQRQQKVEERKDPWLSNVS